MADRSGNHRRRRLVLLGLVLMLIPMTVRSRDPAACETDNLVVGVLICAPLDLLRILGPFARFLFSAPPPQSPPGLLSRSEW
jgi:hypothetical protein